MTTNDNSSLSRRSMLKNSAIAGAGVILAAGCETINSKDGATMKSSNFYKNGALQGNKLKEAYFSLMKSFNYPIPDVLKKDGLWVCDFLQEDICSLGMGGVFWMNEQGVYGKDDYYNGKYKKQQYGYLGHDIFMLPGQTLPEHHHTGGPEGFGPKMEAWHVRYGEVVFYGEHNGAGDEVLISELPKEDRPWGYGKKWFKSKYAAKRDATKNIIYTQKYPESWHGLKAGPKGAIITEYATFHNDVSFSKPKMVFGSTGQ